MSKATGSLMAAAALGLASAPYATTYKRRGRDGKYPGPETCVHCGKKIAGRIALKQHVKAKHHA